MPEALTYFAPAARAAPERIGSQAEYFRAPSLLAEILDFLPTMVVILNRERQIVYANRAAQSVAGKTQVLGLRPGEMLRCKHSDEPPAGCGTTLFCRYCGAANAILQSQAGRLSVEECRITALRGGIEEAIDLRVWASPIRIQGEDFTFFVLANIADEKRRQFLENIFLHDLMNTATSLRGFAELLGSGADTESREFYREQLARLCERVIREITAQRQLVAAENGELQPSVSVINSLELVNEVLREYSHKELLSGRRLILASDTQAVEFHNDATLLARVLGNMVKNAIEASLPDEPVTVGCRGTPDQVVFWVHNTGWMPEPVCRQLFQRSFSTKGPGRGLGTYSMRYLSEKYLGGKISFTSTETEGTTFTAAYPIRWAGPQPR